MTMLRALVVIVLHFLATLNHVHAAELPPPVAHGDVRDSDRMYRDLINLKLLEILPSNETTSVYLLRNPDVSLLLHDISIYEAIKAYIHSSGSKQPTLQELGKSSNSFSASENPRNLLILAAFFEPQEQDSAIILPVLRNYLNSKYSVDRALAAIGMGRIQRGSKPILDKAMKTESNSIVKLHIAYSLWHLTKDSNKTINYYINMLDSTEKGVPDLAALLIGEMGVMAKDAIPSLCTHINHSDPYVRAQIMYALGKMSFEGKCVLPTMQRAIHLSENREAAVEVKMIEVINGEAHIDYRRYSVSAFGHSALRSIQRSIPQEDDKGRQKNRK